jgi:hypothetical protein
MLHSTGKGSRMLHIAAHQHKPHPDSAGEGGSMPHTVRSTRKGKGMLHRTGRKRQHVSMNLPSAPGTFYTEPAPRLSGVSARSALFSALSS